MSVLTMDAIAQESSKKLKHIHVVAHPKDFKILSTEYMSLHGKTINVSASGFSDMLAMLKTTEDGIKYTASLYQVMWHKLMSDMLEKINQDMVFLLNHITNDVIRVGLKSDIDKNLSFDNFMDVMTPIINLKEDIQIKNYGFNQGTMSISYFRESVVDTGIQDETFYQGKTLNFDPFKGIVSELYLNRRVCDNGASVRLFSKQNPILNKGSRPEDWFRSVNIPDDSHQLGNDLRHRIMNMKNINLSARELLAIEKSLTDSNPLEYGKWGDDLNISGVKSAYFKKGIDLLDLNQKQLANCTTNVPIWEGVNALTYYGSHRTNSNPGFGTMMELSKKAGRMMFSKEWDCSNHMSNLPSFN